MRRISLDISIALVLTCMTRCRASSTITAINPFNADEDADKILGAVKGFGTDEKVFVDILTKRTCKQREEIRRARDDTWINDIKGDFFMDDETLTIILSSMYCGPAFYRFYFKRAFEDEDAAAVAEMLSILSHQPDVLDIVKTEYFEAEQITFDGAMSHAFSGNFLNWCSQIIMTKRDVAGKVDQGVADKEAAALLASMKSWQTDRNKLNECLMKPPMMQVRGILTKFKELNKQTDLSTAITRAQLNDRDLVTGYLYLIHDLSDELDFIVTRLKELTDASDDLGLTRLILGRSEIDLIEAKRVYQDRYKIPLSLKLQEIVDGTQLDLLLGFLGESRCNADPSLLSPSPPPPPPPPPPPK